MAEASAGLKQIPHEQTVACRVRPRSIAWENFTHFTTVDGKSKAECKRCHRVFIAPTRNGTRSLLRHLKDCKGLGANGTDELDLLLANVASDLPPLPCDPPPLSPFDPPPLPCTDLPLPFPCDPPLPLPFSCHLPPPLPCTNIPPPVPYDLPPPLPRTDPPPPFPCAPSCCDDELPDREHEEEKEANKHLAQMIALHGHDPLLIEDECFRSFVGSLNPEFKLPSRLAIEEMCDGIFDEARKDLLSRLSHTPGRVSLAIATAKIMDGKVLYTACHFIDDEWKLHKVVLDAYLVGPVPIFYGALSGLPEVTLNSDCFKWTINDVANGISKRGILDKLFMVAWEMGGMDVDVEMQGYMKQKFCTGFQTEVICVMFMDRSFHFIAERLKLPVDLTTKTFNGMEKLDLTRQKRHQLFSHMGLEYLQAHDQFWYSIYCSLKILQKDGSNLIADTDKELAEVFCKVWGQLYQGIQRISASRGPTSNLCLIELFKVREVLQSELARTTARGKDVADILTNAKFILEMLIEVACQGWSVPLMLDPRYKLTYIKFTFSRAFGSFKAAQKISKVTRGIKNMFADYIESDDGISGADSDRVTQNVATGSGASDPLEAWDEHRRSQNGRADDGSSLDAEEGLRHRLEDPSIGTAAGSSTDSLEQAWEKHCRSRDSRIDTSSYLAVEKELDRYLDDDLAPQTEGFDILNWWKIHSLEYPTVARMARDVLAMPTCSKLSSDQMGHVRSIIRGYSKKKYKQLK
ncbi:unnamed protein product [Urochloa decumbens]|uniref:BED-type domain-containing protein n=1 Tax=Urochloa decumbens TaxID=240449 RepID=A0ABC9BNS4_9POAL